MSTQPMRMRVQSWRCLPGCAGGLTETTALVEVSVSGSVDFDTAMAGRLRAGARALCPDQPLHVVGELRWPDDFLAEPSASLGGWVVALTVAIQRWGRDAVWRGRVVEESADRLRLAIPWQREAVFIHSLNLALDLIAEWVSPEPDDSRLAELSNFFRSGLEAHTGGLLKDTLRFIEAAVRRGIPFRVRPLRIQLGWGAQSEFMDASFTSATGRLAAGLAKNKAKTIMTLGEARVPVPESWVVADLGQARQVAADWGWPVVVKPLDQDSGIGVVPGIRDADKLQNAFTAAAALSPGRVMVEKHVEGECYRLLVVQGRLLAANRRIPAGVIGDGESTIISLVESANTDPRRGTTLKILALDGEALENLAEQGFGPHSVPPRGQRVWLRRTAYTDTGGHHEDVGDVIHPDNIALAVRVARLVGLDIAGVDLLTTDIARSWRETGAVVNEVNSQPSFVQHWIADPDRDLNGEVLDVLFAGRSGRIPTAAVTGGGEGEAAAVAGVVQRIWAAAGVLAGVCTREGVWIGDEQVAVGDCSGLPGIRVVLGDPGVGAGVFEVPAARVVEFGHGCDRYDVVAVLRGGAGAGELAGVDGPVAERAGAAVVDCSGDSDGITVRMRAGGQREVVVEARGGVEWIVLVDGGNRTALLAAERVDPALDPGVARFAAAIAWAQGIDTTTIAKALTG